MAKQTPLKNKPTHKATQKGGHNDPWNKGYTHKGGYGSYDYGSGYDKTTCHTEHHMVFEAHGVKFHLGRYSAVGQQHHDLVLDLADGVKSMVNILNPTPVLAAFAAKYAATVLKINWPDMGIPSWTKPMWLDLVDAIVKDPDIKSVYVCCMGGHGRTGTAASILGCLLGAIPEGECPVTWIRTNYCKNTVESTSQLKYVTDMTGREVKAESSKGFYSGGGAATTGKSWTGPDEVSWKPEEYWGEFFDPKTPAPTIPEFKGKIYAHRPS